MRFFQPQVPMLPSGIDLTGKTIIVTGATAGIGLEICRQLLGYKVSNLIMAVRNVSKGEKVRQALLKESEIERKNPKASITVLELDTENYTSVRQFASTFEAKFQDLHVFMANAGIGTNDKEFASSGHEKNMQVNYFSNVLLTLLLLPILERTASKTGKPSKVTWTGSREYANASLSGKHPLGKGDLEVLKHFDVSEGIDTLGRYGDSKLMCLLFQRQLAKHYGPEKVIINSFCPGLVNTSMTDVLPFHRRMIMVVVKALIAREPAAAGRIALYAAAVASTETHGRLLGDMELDEPSEYLKSEESRRVGEMVWNETIDEMARIVAIPTWMKKRQLN
ncbi:unnamed protein product [Clonostachys rhizophaga]|uniref:Uncharacterized protein n=1 Tax=Clonostachys rhizophaga TaxID=160324 RepID=A0A9N9VGM9_9HYPO|nr:unnamed protein product [Clonostachys rhizophaga]